MTPEEKDDDEPRYTAWLDLPISTREPMTAKDANAARARSEAHREAAVGVCGRQGQGALRAGAKEPITRLPWCRATLALR